MKYLEDFDSIPVILKEPIFEKAFKTSEIGAMGIDEYETYQESLLGYWESKGMIDTARAEGKAEGKIETAINAIKMGLSDEVILNLTGLTLGEILKLRK